MQRGACENSCTIANIDVRTYTGATGSVSHFHNGYPCFACLELWTAWLGGLHNGAAHHKHMWGKAAQNWVLPYKKTKYQR